MITVLNSYGNKTINYKHFIYSILITVTITVLKMALIRLLGLFVHKYALYVISNAVYACFIHNNE